MSTETLKTLPLPPRPAHLLFCCLCVSVLEFLCVPFHWDLLSCLMVLVFVFFQTREFSANISWTIFVLRFTFFLSTSVWYPKSWALYQQLCCVAWVLPSGMSWHPFLWVIFPSAMEPVCVLFILCSTPHPPPPNLRLQFLIFVVTERVCDVFANNYLKFVR